MRRPTIEVVAESSKHTEPDSSSTTAAVTKKQQQPSTSLFAYGPLSQSFSAAPTKDILLFKLQHLIQTHVIDPLKLGKELLLQNIAKFPVLALLGIVQIKKTSKEYDTGIEILEKCEKRIRGTGSLTEGLVYLSLADCYQATWKHEMSLSYARKALEVIKDTDPMARFYIRCGHALVGVSHMYLDRFDEAEASFRAAFPKKLGTKLHDTGSASAMMTMAVLLAITEKLDKALAYARKAYDELEKSKDGYPCAGPFIISWILKLQGKEEEAEAMLSHFSPGEIDLGIRLHPSYKGRERMRQTYLLQQERYSEAEKCIEDYKLYDEHRRAMKRERELGVANPDSSKSKLQDLKVDKEHIAADDCEVHHAPMRAELEGSKS